jgi:hypothetical protein
MFVQDGQIRRIHLAREGVSGLDPFTLMEERQVRRIHLARQGVSGLGFIDFDKLKAPLKPKGPALIPFLPFTVPQLLAMIDFQKKKPLFDAAKLAMKAVEGVQARIQAAGERVRRSRREDVFVNDLKSLQADRWLVEKVKFGLTEFGMKLIAPKLPKDLNPNDPAEGPWLRARKHMDILSTMAADYLASYPPADPDPDNAFWGEAGRRLEAFMGGLATAVTETYQAAKNGAKKAKDLAAKGADGAAQAAKTLERLAATAAELAAQLAELSKKNPAKALLPFGLVVAAGVGALALFIMAGKK